MTSYLLLLVIFLAIAMIYVNEILDGIDTFLAWLSYLSKQTTSAYCDLQTADSETDLVTHEGALVSIIEIQVYTALLGKE